MRVGFFIIFELLIIAGILYCIFLLIKKNAGEIKKHINDNVDKKEAKQ